MYILGKHDLKYMMCDGMGGWTGRGGGRPRKERPCVNICRDPAYAITVFDLRFMMHRNGLWAPAKRPKHISGEDLVNAFAAEVLEPKHLTVDDEVWPLVASLKVNQDQADQAALTRLPGYLFYHNYNIDRYESFAPEFIPERRFCVEPALVLGVLARNNGGFYQSDRSPDYRIGALCGNAGSFSDPRLTGEPMYPLWKKNQKAN